ncbi:hypothetical protein C9F11_17990 [Streptomyces sp. YIM 121038]|nr:hypothetical protein C9F11_17990 [Streptomyces sp. YIM 121038]
MRSVRKAPRAPGIRAGAEGIRNGSEGTRAGAEGIGNRSEGIRTGAGGTRAGTEGIRAGSGVPPTAARGAAPARHRPRIQRIAREAAPAQKGG